MGYETKIYLASQFSDRWVSKKRFHSPDNPELDRLPDDALISSDFLSIAEIDLCKCGYDGPVYKLFLAGREKQKKLKRYASVDYEGFTHIEGEYKGESDSYNVLVDCYDEPLGVHDPVEVLDALRKEIQQDIYSGSEPYRRFVMAEALIASVVESRLPALSRLGAQAEGAAVDRKSWLFDNLVILSYGH